MNKKEKLLQVALKLFTERGIRGTPTIEITKEAGVANGTLFYHFKTKEELVVELYLRIRKKLNEYLADGFDENADVKSKIQHLFLNGVYCALEHEAENKFIEQFRFSAHVADVHKKDLKIDKTLYLRAIEQGIEEEIIKTEDIDFVVMVLSTLAAGLHSYLSEKKFSRSKQHQIIGETFERLWKMLT